MSYIPVTGVVGSDGNYPLVEDEPLWRMWALFQIYLGTVGSERYVPKVKDWVCDPDTGEVWVVDHIDPITLIPTLRPINFGRPSGSFNTLDSIVSSGPGAPSDVYRLYINDSVFPHSLAVDAAVHVRGQALSYFKIFAGFDTHEDTGKVISKLYDASNNFISNAIPLELAALDSHTNYSTKCFTRCHCTEKHLDDELVTVVVYADDGHVVYKRQLLIENTDTIMDVHASVKYITDISLESIWLSNTEPSLIEFPLNIPMNALNMVGVVLYSDGSRLRYPVDGNKFAMPGLDGYLSSIPGHPADLVLRYTLSANEQSYSSAGANNNYVTKPYKITTTNENKSIAVKLFGYPEWLSDALGYRMRWFLLNMERNIKFDVTDKVRFSANTGAFEPMLFGVAQRKSVSINLAEVSTSFMPFVHTQLVDIVLFAPPTNDVMTSWSVSTEASDVNPRFGTDIYGKIVADKVNLASGLPAVSNWLDAFYRKTYPLTDRNAESQAPNPTHFTVIFNGTEVEFPISAWNQDLNIGTGVGTGKTIIVRFSKKTVDNILQLAYAAALLKIII